MRSSAGRCLTSRKDAIPPAQFVQCLEQEGLHFSSLVHDEPADTVQDTCNKSWGHPDLGAEPARCFPEPVLSHRVAFPAYLGITIALVDPV